MFKVEVYYVPIAEKSNQTLKGRNDISEELVKRSYLFDPFTNEFDATIILLDLRMVIAMGRYCCVVFISYIHC